MSSEVVDGHVEGAQTVTLADGARVRKRLLAPAGYTGPTTPTDWVPLSGGVLTSDEVDVFSAGWSIYEPRGSATTVDELAAVASIDSEYPAAFIDCYVSAGVDQVYYAAGLTTYSPGLLFAGDLPLPGPNQTGPEYQAVEGGDPLSWRIRGNWDARALLHGDAAAAQLENTVLKIALVPHALVEESPEEEPGRPDTQWTWREWPTQVVLDELTLVHTEPAPALSDYSWSDYTTYDRALLPISIDLAIDPSWVVDGHTHFAYWLERTDAPGELYTMDYAGVRTPTSLNTWASYGTGVVPSSIALDSTGNTAGSWSKDSDGGLYLSTYTGAVAGGRVLYSYGTGNDGRLNGDRRMHWTWLAVADNTFGYAIFTSPWSRQLVVTPDGVYDYDTGVGALLVAHSTPFAAGDVCDVVVTGTTVSVQRGGVEVSTFTLPAVYIFNGNGLWAMHWAGTANAGNRLSGVDTYGAPTSHGETGLYGELAFGAEPSIFVGSPTTAYRFLQWTEFPVFAKERWEYSTQEPEWTAWLRLVGPSDAFMTYVGMINTHVDEIDPLTVYPDWPQQRGAGWQRCIRRWDGMLVMTDVGSTYSGYVADYRDWVTLPNGMLREDGFDPVLGYNFGGPQESMAASNIMATYVRVTLGSEAVEGTGIWRTEEFADMVFQAQVLQGVDYSPGVWHWQPGDNHDGFQDIGYAHAPITPMPLGPSSPVNGMALQFQSSIEGWVYDGREGVYGYHDSTGPFFYGWLNPAGYPGDIFGSDAIYSYDHGQTDGGAGREVGRLAFGLDWTAQRWGTEYDATYPGFDHGDMYMLMSPGFGNEGQLLHSLPGAGVYSDLLGPIVPLGLTHGWAIGAYREWEVLFMIHLSTYPNSVFVSWYRQSNSGDYAVPEFITQEIDKATGAVVRVVENCPPGGGVFNPYNVSDAISYAQASPDGKRIEWCFTGGTWSIGDLISEFYLLNIECAYGTAYPANAYAQRWWPNNAVLTADAASYDVWLKATQVAAGSYGLTSDFGGMNRFWGEVCNGQALVRATAPVSVQYGMEFYDDDRTLLETQWGALTAAPAGDSVVSASLTPPANTYWIKMVFRSSGDAPSFAIRHPGLWRPGRPVGNRTFETSAISSQFASWDAATDTLSTHEVSNGGDELMGWTYDGRLIVGYVRTRQRLWNPYTDETTTPYLEDYEGHGYNGGFIGSDGRYLYFHQLNYHIEPTAYVLSEAEIARIDPHCDGTYSGGPLPVAGDTIGFGRGVAKTFDEFYRYDLSLLSSPPGPDLVSNGSGVDGITGWQYAGNGGSHLEGGAPFKLRSNDGYFDFMSMYSDQGSVATSGYGGSAIAIAPSRSYRISANFATDGSFLGRIYYLLRLFNAAGDLVDTANYELPSPDQGEIEHNWGFTFDVGSDVAGVMLEIGIESTTTIAAGAFMYVHNIQLRDVGGPIPIEYLFNVDPSYEQTYGVYVEPQYVDFSANFLTENLWNPMAPLSSDDIDYWTGGADVHTAAGGVFYIEKTGGAGTVVVETAKIPVTRWEYGAFDYWQALAQIQVVSGGTSGQAKIQLIAYSADGTQLWVGALTALNLNALVPDVGSFTSLIAPNLQSPGYPIISNVTHYAVRLTLGAVSADLVLAVRRMNLRAGYYAYGLDRDPALGIQRKLNYWNSSSGSSISYDFSWWGWPQSFVPAIAGEEPQLAFSRWLTDPTKASHSDIGFTRMLPP